MIVCVYTVIGLLPLVNGSLSEGTIAPYDRAGWCRASHSSITLLSTLQVNNYKTQSTKRQTRLWTVPVLPALSPPALRRQATRLERASCCPRVDVVNAVGAHSSRGRLGLVMPPSFRVRGVLYSA